jgi:hypothetical protein
LIFFPQSIGFLSLFFPREKRLSHRGPARQAATKKNGLALKLQITKKRNQVAMSEMLLKRDVPGCEKKILAQKTRN